MILNTKHEAIFCSLKDLNVLSLKRCHSVSIDLNSLEGLIIIFNINWCDIQRWQRIKAGSLGDDDIQMVVICLSFHLFFIASGEINIFVFIVYVYKEKRVFKSLSSQVPLWNSQRPFCAFVTLKKSPSMTIVKTENTPPVHLVTFWPNSNCSFLNLKEWNSKLHKTNFYLFFQELVPATHFISFYFHLLHDRILISLWTFYNILLPLTIYFTSKIPAPILSLYISLFTYSIHSGCSSTNSHKLTGNF